MPNLRVSTRECALHIQKFSLSFVSKLIQLMTRYLKFKQSTSQFTNVLRPCARSTTCSGDKVQGLSLN